MNATLDWQLERGALVCPQTKEPLKRIGDTLRCSQHSYSLIGDVPLLLADPKAAERYAAEAPRMLAEYAKPSRFARLRWALIPDYRTRKSISALASVLDVPADALCLSIGGGPFRVNDRTVNVNIGPFRNVDVVGDAHLLPYADESIDAIHCEAVFEHLSHPLTAAREQFRVMKHGAKAYICTPFMQCYHGYPHHYQNYTVSGHRELFQQAGFQVIESGVCVGPVYTLFEIVTVFCRCFVPYPLNRIATAVLLLSRMVIGPLDKVLANHRDAHIMASMTYMIVKKV